MLKVNTIGFAEFEAKLKNAITEIKSEVNAEVIEAGKDFVQRAKRAAPVNEGQLRAGISFFPIGDMTIEVVSAAKHSPFVEWGTILNVQVPAELSEYAAQFKGKGIKKTGGMKPHPFFFVQKPVVQEQFIKRIKAVLSDISGSTNGK